MPKFVPDPSTTVAAPAAEHPEGDGQIGRWTLTDKGRAEFARLEAGR